VFLALQNTNALFADTKFDPSIQISGSDIPALRRKSGFPFMSYGFRSGEGKAILAYWLAAHSLPGNSFLPLYTSFSLKNTGIQNPVLIDVVSGEIRPLRWKEGTTDTIEGLPVKDSIMAIADGDYFDWPVLPESPSSLNAVVSSGAVRLSWEVHGGGPKNILIERREDPISGRGSWRQIAELPSTASEYTDSHLKKGQRVSYRVLATNDEGNSASSNIARITFAP
jgi:hypothetical protein